MNTAQVRRLSWQKRLLSIPAEASGSMAEDAAPEGTRACANAVAASCGGRMPRGIDRDGKTPEKSTDHDSQPGIQ